MVKIRLKTNKKRVYENDTTRCIKNVIGLIAETNNEPIYEYSEEYDFDIIRKLYNKAVMASKLAKEDGHIVDISNIQEYGHDLDTVTYFDITEETDDIESYVIYKIGADIYYRDSSEFFQIIEDLKDEVPGQTIEALKVSYTDKDKELTSYSIYNVDDCMFIVSAIFSALTGNSYDSNNDINENCKIRRPTKISSDNDFDKSKIADEAKHGTKEENDFKQEIEDIQKKDGIVGALDPQQEENAAYKPKLPNVNLIAESNPFLVEGANIEYEVNDKVLYKDEVWDVFSITGIIGDKQKLRITKSGYVVDVLSNEVKPDPSQFDDIDNTPDQFEFDKNNLNKTPKNPKAEKMADLNGKTVVCNIVVDSTILTGSLNGDKFKANLQDILEGLDDIRVQMDDHEQTWHRDNISIEQENWPYAVIASEDDEPLRKIKVNPLSYVEAKDDNDLVDCVVGDKPTQLPKRIIRIIA